MKTEHESTSINYHTSPRAKHLRITVDTDCSVHVTVPRRVSIRTAEAFVSDKSEWIRRSVAHMQKKNAQQTPVIRFTKEDYTKHKETARALVHARLSHFNARYGFTYKSVTIRNQKTRWGSCSHTGALSFNFKILFLPRELQDYIVVHELCHVKELNHSPRFWKLVAQTQPTYTQLRKSLHAFSVRLQ